MPRSNISLESWCINNNYTELLSHLINYNDRYISYSSHTKVDWICSLGHKFSIDPCKFTNPNRCGGNIGIFKCPYCNGQKIQVGFNDLATTRPDLASEWDYDRNNITPQQVTKGSHKDVWWKCKNGHSWKARISARDYKNGCPYCASISRTSRPEQLLYAYVKKYFPDALNMYSSKGVSLDVYIPSLKIAIEYDGSYWHSNKDTSYKFDFCRNNGIKLYKITGVATNTPNTYIIDDTGLNIEYFPNQLTIVMQKLFLDVFNINIDYSDYSMHVESAINSYINNSSLDITDDMIKHWSPLNGYSIKGIRNNNKSKYWRCNNGHTFERRYDVVKKFGLVCPYCKRFGNHIFYLIYAENSTYIIYDRIENTIESLDYNSILSYINLGYNIGNLYCIDNKLLINFSQLKSACNTALRNIFENIFYYDLINVSTDCVICNNVYNKLKYFINNSNIQQFVYYIKQNGFVY